MTQPIKIVLACVAAFASAAGAQAATCVAEAIAVDTRAGGVRTIAPCDIQYSPNWCGVEESGAYVVIEKVEHAGMFNAVTSTVTTLTADAEGGYNYALGAEDARCVRFIHRVLNSGGTEIGDALVRDVGFGVVSTPGDSMDADCRTNSFLEAVAAGGPVNLTYSTAWATNAAQVSIKSIPLSGKGGAPVATNDMFSAEAPAEGVTPMRGVGQGWARLLCQVADRSGDVLIEYLTDEFKSGSGFFIIVR